MEAENPDTLDDNLTDFKSWGFAFGTESVVQDFKYEEIISCDGQESFDLKLVPVGSSISTTTSSSKAMFGVGNQYQSVPVGAQIKIIASIADSPITRITCTEGDSVTFFW